MFGKDLKLDDQHLRFIEEIGKIMPGGFFICKANEDVEPKENYIKACCNVLLSDTIKSDRIIYLDNDVEINPMTHSKELFYKWVDNYPLFSNIEKEDVLLYES